MIPHKQRFRHDPENGVYGDCYRTALACLLDLEPEEVPHENRQMTGEEFLRYYRAWLAERGLTLWYFRYTVPPEQGIAWMFEAMGSWNGDQPFMLSGKSPRGTNHVVIATRAGIIWDPHPDGGDLVGPDEDGCYNVEVIGALAPARQP